MREIEANKTNCPYCGFGISNDIEQCPNCNEWFVEPHLDGFKLLSLPMNIAFMLLFYAAGMFHLYSIIWVLFNAKAFINIANQKDIKKFKTIFGLFIVSTVLIILSKYVVFATAILSILLSYRLLRIIEKYTLKKYNSPVTHHEMGMIFFRILYVIYYIDTYKARVYDPKLRYFLDKKKWFEYLVLCIVLSFIIFYQFGYSVIFFFGF